MDAREIIKFIQEAEKKTPVKVTMTVNGDVEFPGCQVFGEGSTRIVFGDWKDVEPALEANGDKIADYFLENNCRNSAIPMVDMK